MQQALTRQQPKPTVPAKESAAKESSLVEDMEKSVTQEPEMKQNDGGNALSMLKDSKT